MAKKNGDKTLQLRWCCLSQQPTRYAVSATHAPIHLPWPTIEMVLPLTIANKIRCISHTRSYTSPFCRQLRWCCLSQQPTRYAVSATHAPIHLPWPTIEMVLPLTTANKIRCISHTRSYTSPFCRQLRWCCLSQQPTRYAVSATHAPLHLPWPTRCGFPGYVGRQALTR